MAWVYPQNLPKLGYDSAAGWGVRIGWQAKASDSVILGAAYSGKGNPAMTPWYIFPLAFLVGILFNLNPSCGSGTLVWTSTQKEPWKIAMLASIRIAVLALVGAFAGYFGTVLRAPWGVLMIGAAMYLLYTTLRQMRAGGSGVCALPRKSSALPWSLALVPPPSGYIGLAFFYGGFNPPSPSEGALTLALVGLGLTLPVWTAILKPQWWATWQRHLMGNPRMHRAQIIFQFAGVAVLTVVGLAFIFVRDFHRPLLELIQ